MMIYQLMPLRFEYLEPLVTISKYDLFITERYIKIYISLELASLHRFLVNIALIILRKINRRT